MTGWKANTEFFKIYKGTKEVTKVYKGTKEAYANRRFIDPTLVLYLDAGYRESYPREGTSWYNLVDNSAGTLVNGVSYVNTDPKYMSFDGADDYVTVIGDGDDNGYNLQTFTLETWVYFNSLGDASFIAKNDHTSSPGSNTDLNLGRTTTFIPLYYHER